MESGVGYSASKASLLVLDVGSQAPPPVVACNLGIVFTLGIRLGDVSLDWQIVLGAENLP